MKLSNFTQSIKGRLTPKLWLLLLGTVFSWSMASAQCKPEIQGGQYVCEGSTVHYEFTGGNTSGGVIPQWSISPGAGTFVGGISTGLFVDIQWNTIANMSQMHQVFVDIPANVVCPAGGRDTLDVVVGTDAAFQMSCNDSVQISLGLDCKASVSLDMVWEGTPPLPDSFFNIYIYPEGGGDTIPDDTLRATEIGKTLIVSLVHKCSGNSCWGRIFVEDKLPPDELICSTDTIECGADSRPEVISIGFPLAPGVTATPVPGKPRHYTVVGLDNCSNVDLSYEDDVQNDTCPFVQVIYRKWIATDGHSTSMCTDTIHVNAGTITNTIWPKDWTGLPGDERVLKCDENFKKLPAGHDYEGNPHPDMTGWPFGGKSCSNIAQTFNDRKLQICESSYKILREWILIDWCHDTIAYHTQIIEVLDTDGPILNCKSTCASPITVNTDPGQCTGHYLLPVPVECDNCGIVNIVSECSSWTYSVRHKGSPPGKKLSCAEDGQAIYTNAYIREVIRNGKKRYEAYDLPTGYNWFEYTVKDACGNQTSCTIEILVIENEPPTPVCDEHTVISIGSGGITKVYAKTLDDGSHDNCSPEVWVKVLRMDEIACDGLNGDDDAGLAGIQVYFDDFAMFCCEDIGQTRMVTMRAFDINPGPGAVHPSRMEAGGDLYGHFADCMVEVEVQDDTPPVLTCPSRLITAYCGDQLDSASLTRFGTASVSDECPVSLVYTVKYYLNDCGQGYILRKWVVKEQPTITCTQRITVRAEKGFDLSKAIRWPKDISEPNGCLKDLDPESLNSKPSVKGSVNTGCHKIIFNYKDKVYNIVDGACFKIVRTWSALDDCTNQTAEWKQYIKVLNSIKPTIVCPGSVRVPITGSDCSAYVKLTATAQDECTPGKSLKWSWEIDLNSDGSVDKKGTGDDASGTFSYGKNGIHRIKWKVEDLCGNSATCTTVFTLSDKKKPSPYCRDGIVTVIMRPSGEIELWAKDFNLGSYDNCTPDDELRFSFDGNTVVPNRTFRCDDIANDLQDTLDIKMWVWDKANNRDYCSVILVLQKGDNCHPTNSAMIAGTIQDEKERGVRQVKMNLSTSFDSQMNYETDEEGKFEFGGLPLKKGYVVTPSKNDDFINGVSTKDLVAIQKHLLGISPFNQPTQFIAADANNSHSISSGDIVEIRRLILGKIEEYTHNTSWRFVPQNYTFENPYEPWKMQESIAIQPLLKNEMKSNFKAIKIGDLNGDVKLGNISNENGTRGELETLALSYEDMHFNRGDQVVLKLVNKSEDIEGLQFAMKYDTDLLKFSDLHTTGSFKVNNVGLSHADKGELRFSWNDVKGMLSEDVITLVFEAKSSGVLHQAIHTATNIIPNEAYAKSGVDYRVVLRALDNGGESAFALLQNKPNPFDKSTTIAFILPKEEYATLSVFDVTGKMITVIEGKYAKGYNEITLDKSQLSTRGLLYYRLETKEQTATRKMIMID